MNKTIDERADEYVGNALLMEGTYKGDVQTAYCCGCSDQNLFLVNELQEELKILKEEYSSIGVTSGALLYKKMRLYGRIEGLEIAIEIIRQWPNESSTVHASRYSNWSIQELNHQGEINSEC